MISTTNWLRLHENNNEESSSGLVSCTVRNCLISGEEVPRSDELLTSQAPSPLTPAMRGNEWTELSSDFTIQYLHCFLPLQSQQCFMDFESGVSLSFPLACATSLCNLNCFAAAWSLYTFCEFLCCLELWCE